ncbi:MAG: hypothetical protein B6I25_06085 [Planctomycetales bacterium 4572_13]|nr:MAG: hypothetical protein B6I25_06085 [Planctomycetales bacterium 4572_13]
MTSNHLCSLQKQLRIVPGGRRDYEALAQFHYRGAALGPTRGIYKLVDEHLWRHLAAPVVGVIVYGSPPANLAGRNAATGGVFAGLDRAAGLTLLNEQMVCIRRVIIEPRYRGLGLAGRLVAETMPLTGSPMVEAVSVMGRVHPFFERAGMQAFAPAADAKTERMKAALEAVGVDEHHWHDSVAIGAKIEHLSHPLRRFIDDEMGRFCQKFTNRRQMAHSCERTEFVLSKLAGQGGYYLWDSNSASGANKPD